jgi:Ni2+-binding GTPase involved in maturation of urease and hydrogenase
MDVNVPPLWLLTGPIGSGKTTFCRHLIQDARERGWQVGGLLSPAWMDGDKKIGILLEDIHTGEQRTLATTAPQPQADLQLGPWHFDERVLELGNHIITESSPCDLLIVDELGPLEFNHKVGLTASFGMFLAGQYRVGCAVIRPSLLEAALVHWPWAQPIDILEASIQKLLPLL